MKRTFESADLLLENLLILSFRDTIPVDEDVGRPVLGIIAVKVRLYAVLEQIVSDNDANRQE